MQSDHSKHSLGVLALTHQDAPLDVREKFSMTTEGRASLYRTLLNNCAIEECVILNTCNRCEVYVAGNKEAIESTIKTVFCQFHNVALSYLNQYSTWHSGEEAVRHLFEVSASLDSQMPGETEILGQVKAAYQVAQEAKTTGPMLNPVFQKSFQAAKWIRTHTDIAKGQVSLGNVAAELAIRIFGELKTTRILMIGTGDIGQQTLQCIHSRGGGSITVASRTLGRARLLASKHNGVAVDFEHIGNILRYFDVIICATASTHPIITQQQIKESMRERPDEPLFLIDQAVPRDVEANIKELTNVYLYNLDDLAAIANENLKGRQRELNKCRSVIREKASYLWKGLEDSHSGTMHRMGKAKQ